MKKFQRSMKGGEGMSIAVLVIGIVVFIGIAYYVYITWFAGVTNLASGQMNLNTTKAPTPILANTLQSPSATRFTYGIWIYVNTWDTTMPKVIFSRYNDMLVYLDAQSAVLNCIISPRYAKPPATDALMDLKSATTIPTQFPTGSINITNNFPIQKWVYVTIAVDNQIADFYLDGKMVKSLTIPQVGPDSTSSIFYGYGFDAIITGFQRWNYVLDPQTIYNNYISGGSTISSSLSGGYHARVTVSKNNNDTSTYKLF